MNNTSDDRHTGSERDTKNKTARSPPPPALLLLVEEKAAAAVPTTTANPPQIRRTNSGRWINNVGVQTSY